MTSVQREERLKDRRDYLTTLRVRQGTVAEQIQTVEEQILQLEQAEVTE